MMNFIVVCSLLLVLCKIGVTFALPAEVYRVSNTYRALSDLGVAKKCTGKEVGLEFPTGVKFFWSGFGVSDGKKAAQVAAEIADFVAEKERQKTWTLETILKYENNSLIKTCDLTEPYDPVCVQFWHDLSCEYAKKARGDIRFILGPKVRPDSNWMQVERAQIRHNQQSGKDVYGFKKYDLQTIYCKEMINRVPRYPNVKKDICT